MKVEWKLYELPVGPEAEAKMKELTEDGWVVTTPTFIQKTIPFCATYVCFAAFKDLTEYPTLGEFLGLVPAPVAKRRDLA